MESSNRLSQEIKKNEELQDQLKSALLTIEELKGENEELKEKNEEFQKKLKGYEKKIEIIEEDKKLLVNSLEKSEIMLLEEKTKACMNYEEIAKLKQIEDSQQQQILDLAQQNSDLMGLNYYSKKVHESVPFYTIHTDSILSLNQDGWSVKSQLENVIPKLEDKMLVVCSIIGSTGSGISWLANQLSGNQLPYGWQNSPNSISLHYINNRDSWFTILESSGLNEPIRACQAKISKLSDSQFYQNDNDEQKILSYQTPYDDSNLLEHLKLLYIIHHTGIILYVVGKFTQIESENILRIKRMIKDIMKTKTAAKSTQLPQLIIIHNFSWLKTVSHVQQEFKKSVGRVFSLEEQALFNNKLKAHENCCLNKSLWKDEFGFTHLITATEKTEAGNYYNPGTLNFLFSKLDCLEIKRKLSFCSSFADFCSQELSNRIGMDLLLKYTPDKSKIIISNKASKINPPQLFYASLSNVVQMKFEPKYSTKVETLNQGQEAVVVVEVELIDSSIDKKSIVQKQGKNYLVIKGLKRQIFDEETKQRENNGKFILNKGTRKEGNYSLNIPLVSSCMKYDKIISEDQGFGVKRFIIYFKKEEEKFL